MLENKINRPKVKLINSNAPDVNLGLKLFNRRKGNILNAHSTQVNVLFLKTFLHSFKDEKNEFSNFIVKLGISTTPLYSKIISLKKNPSQIADEISPIDILHKKNSKRIREILIKCTDRKVIQKFNDSVFESVVDRGNDFFDSNGKGKLRVFSIYAVDAQNLSKIKQYLVVILLDPYHLVCPIRDTCKKLSNIKNQHYIYQKCKDRKDSLEVVFKQEFDDESKKGRISLIDISSLK